MPATWKMSLIATGIPCSGPRRRPARASSVRSRAVARAPDSSTETHACTAPSVAAMRCRHASSSADGESAPSAMRREAARRPRERSDRSRPWREGSCGARPRAVKTTAHRRKCGGFAFPYKRAVRCPATEATREARLGRPEQAIDSTSASVLGTGLAPGTAVRIRQVRGAGERDGVSVPSPPTRRTEHPAFGLPGHTEVGRQAPREEDRMNAREATRARIDLRNAKLCMELDCNTVFDAVMYPSLPDLRQRRVLPARVLAQPRPHASRRSSPRSASSGPRGARGDRRYPAPALARSAVRPARERERAGRGPARPRRAAQRRRAG